MDRKKFLTALVCVSLSGGLYVSAADTAMTNADDVDTIIVTADRVPTKKSDTPANVTVVTSQQIENNRYQSVQEALVHVNGVNVVEMSNGTFAAVRLNGDDRVAVLVDGQSITNAQGMSTGRGVLDLTTLPGTKNIERIEVVKGNGSALYGSDAVGGVINIITKKGTANETTLDVNTGSWGTHNYGLTNEGTHGKTSWFVTGSIGHRNYYEYRDGDSTGQNRGDYQDNTFTARIDQKINNGSSLKFNISHKSFDGDNIGYVNYGTIIKSASPMERLSNNYSVTYNFKEDTTTPGYFRYFNNYTTTYLWSRYNVRTQGFQLQDGWQVNNNRITAGLEWQEDKASNSNSGYTDVKRTNRSAYVEDIIDLGKLSVTPGLRLDDNSTFGFHKTPKVALNYKANDKFNAYASWGRVFSAPHMDDLYYYGAPYMYGNPNLKPETGHSETVGFNYQLDKKTTLNVNWFQSKLDNAIRWYSSNPDDYAIPWQVANVNSEKKHGIEISMNKIINNIWSYEMGYSYIYTKTDKGDNKGYRYDIGNSQPNGYHAGVHFAKNAWKANLLMTAGTGRNTTIYSGSSYVVWDGSVSYDANKATTLYFKMNNITNKGYEMYQYYPMPGRYFQFGVKYTF